MNRRGKRLTLGVMVVGIVVVLALAIAHWGTVRDHVEAWWFQLTCETETIDLSYGHKSLREETGLLQLLTDTSGCAVIRERADSSTDRGVYADWSVWVRETRTEMCLRLLRENGYRVLEQRFPAKAYVVIRDQTAEPVVIETLLVPFVKPTE